MNQASWKEKRKRGRDIWRASSAVADKHQLELRHVLRRLLLSRKRLHVGTRVHVAVSTFCLYRLPYALRAIAPWRVRIAEMAMCDQCRSKGDVQSAFALPLAHAERPDRILLSIGLTFQVPKNHGSSIDRNMYVIANLTGANCARIYLRAFCIKCGFKQHVTRIPSDSAQVV